MFLKFIKNVFIIFLFTCLVISCYRQVTVQPKPDDPNSAFKFYSNAVKLYNEANYDKALPQINNAIELNARISKYYHLKANILQKLNRPDEALTAFDQVLALRSFNPEVLEKTGLIYARKKNYYKAIQKMKKALAQKPNYHHLLINIAEYYWESGKYEFAYNFAKSYKRQMDKGQAGIYPDYYRVMGKIFFKRKDFTGAANFFDKIESSKMLNPDEIKIVIYSYFKARQFDKAYEYISNLTNDKITIGNLYFFRSLYYYHKANFNDAQTQFEHAIKNNTDEALVYFYLGKIYMQNKNHEKARQMFKLYRDKAGKFELEENTEFSTLMLDN